MSEVVSQGYDFGPESGTTTALSEVEQYTYDMFYQKLRHYKSQLPPALQKKVSKADLKELATVLLDRSIFDIVRELEEIQQLNEKDLLNRRIKMVCSHKTQKMAQAKQHEKELASCRPHNVPLIKRRHESEKSELDKKLQKEMKRMDQNIILELDQLVTDQQSTMNQADVPLFTVTNSPAEIQLQMHMLKMIQKLSELPTPMHKVSPSAD